MAAPIHESRKDYSDKTPRSVQKIIYMKRQRALYRRRRLDK